MKKICCVLMILLLLPGSIPVAVAQRSLGLSAQSAVLIDAHTLQVLYTHNAHTPMPVASTTKIMTTLLLLEAGEPGLSFAVTDNMVQVEGTSMGLRAGDTVTREALAIGLLLASGNDAANATAMHLAGDLPSFATMMNARARAIGMTQTNFVTPSGLDAEGHLSTAFDMALLGAAAIANPDFRAISSQSSMRAHFGNPPTWHYLRNHNRLVREIPGCIGIKTGFTRAAGRTLVSAVERDGRTLIAVTLHAPNDWQDHRRLFEFGFAQYRSVQLDIPGDVVARLPITNGMVSHANIILAGTPSAYLQNRPQNVQRVLLLRPFEFAPLQAGSVVGTARYYDGTLLLAEAPLIVQSTIDIARPPRSTAQPSLWWRIRNFFRS
ncbi:MAG: D-alanyl-D-alanine carboxypeptidase [Oscillospiraceae bacterium]|nr:D-alanyl-D-alanine carboxypeptidase [Oscillospiraceae bacterium]